MNVNYAEVSRELVKWSRARLTLLREDPDLAAICGEALKPDLTPDEWVDLGLRASKVVHKTPGSTSSHVGGLLECAISIGELEDDPDEAALLLRHFPNAFACGWAMQETAPYNASSFEGKALRFRFVKEILVECPATAEAILSNIYT